MCCPGQGPADLLTDQAGLFERSLLLSIRYSNRGTGKDPFAIFFDEIYFFNPVALLAILPTLATGAACIFTSSVSVDGDSPIVRMMQTTYPDGSPVVRSLCWVQACMACQRKGIADRCTHIIRMLLIH